LAERVYSTQFIVAVGLTGTSSFACPSGFRMIVRDVDCYSDSVASAGDLFVRNPAGGTIFWQHVGVGVQQIGQWRGRQVFDPGDVLAVVATGTSWDVMVSGYLLTLP
jgi:hypothetical protein